jgi:quinol monooxygenase YgiN
VLVAFGDIYTQIPRRDQIRELMRVTQARVREQPGCMFYAFTEALDDPGHFLVVQQWRDLEALDEHYRSQAFTDYQNWVAAQLVRTSELRVHVVEETRVPLDSSLIDTSADD